MLEPSFGRPTSDGENLESWTKEGGGQWHHH